MSVHVVRRALAWMGASAFAGLAVAGCSSSSAPATVTVLDVTLTFVQGETCNTGGIATEFTAQSGVTVTILASAASNLTPLFVLYGPDYATQVGASQAYGAGRARLVQVLSQSGAQHVSLCEQNGRAGSVRVTVTEPFLGG